MHLRLWKIYIIDGRVWYTITPNSWKPRDDDDLTEHNWEKYIQFYRAEDDVEHKSRANVKHITSYDKVRYLDIDEE